jgi:hypothetical protein
MFADGCGEVATWTPGRSHERLAPPTWHKVVAFAGLGCALAAAVAISLSEERQRQAGPSARKRPDEDSADQPGRLKPIQDAPA